jgi:nicotinamide-nucleotide amidase
MFACMPGVPFEMKRMFSDYIEGQLELFADGKAGGNTDAKADGKIVLVKKIGCFGAGESNIAQMLGDMMRRGRNPLINCTASVGVVTLHIVAKAPDRACAEAMIRTDAEKIRSLLGDLVFGHDDQTIAEIVGLRLARAGKTITVAESCTGGLVAKMLTDSPGASEYFTHGWVTYSDRAKIDELGIDEKLLAQYGAVSEQVAEAMATCARKRALADVAIGITGIAGPGGQTEQKPLGLVFISMDVAGMCTTVRKVFSNTDRSHVRLRTGLTALNMVRLKLGNWADD